MNDDPTPTEFEQRFAERLLLMAEDCTGRGVPPDLVVRCLLGAGMAFAQRFDSGARIAEQLQPVLDELADAPDLLPAPQMQ